MRKSAWVIAVICAAALALLGCQSLDVYVWDTNWDVISLGSVSYAAEELPQEEVRLGRQIGIIKDEESFKVWEVKGVSTEEEIAITGFMFPAIKYRIIK